MGNSKRTISQMLQLLRSHVLPLPVSVLQSHVPSSEEMLIWADVCQVPVWLVELAEDGIPIFSAIFLLKSRRIEIDHSVDLQVKPVISPAL